MEFEKAKIKKIMATYYPQKAYEWPYWLKPTN